MAFLEKILHLFEAPSVDDLKAKKDVKGLWKIILKNDPKNRTQAKEALAELGIDSALFIIEKLKGPNQQIPGGGSFHSKAYRILYLSDPEILEVLQEYRNFGTPDFRRKISELIAHQTKRKAILGLDGGSDQIQRLIMTINNHRENNEVRVHAARKIADLKDKKATKPLIEALRKYSSSNLITFEMANALAQIGEKQAIQPLERVLGRLRDLGSLNHIYWKYVREGVIHPELRDMLNNLLRSKLINLSETAKLTKGGDNDHWKIKDFSTLILLSKGDTETIEEMPGETYHRIQFSRSEGDRLVFPISRELIKLKEKYRTK